MNDNEFSDYVEKYGRVISEYINNENGIGSKLNRLIDFTHSTKEKNYLIQVQNMSEEAKSELYLQFTLLAVKNAVKNKVFKDHKKIQEFIQNTGIENR